MALHLHPDPTGGAVLTKLKLIAVDGTETIEELELVEAPGYQVLRALIEPRLGGGCWMEHVSVWDNFGEGKMRHLDMFVDETGHLKGLPHNAKATAIYRAANLAGKSAAPPVSNPELLNNIVGPVVLFNRRVWF